jgi:ribosomal protein S18 acetylase RimI-like enzyme
MISYRDAVPDDAPAIGALFRQGFIDTFGHIYDPQDLAAFFERFTEEAWRGELADPDFAFRLAEADGALAGYAKISSVSLPVARAGPAAELRQLYVLRRWHGSGIAQALMDWVVAEARARGAEALYLSVFTENRRARSFYARHGFEEVGPYVFMVGSHADEDIIMRLRVQTQDPRL